jgi:hypothetical protein
MGIPSYLDQPLLPFTFIGICPVVLVQVGEPLISIKEDLSQRYITTTGVFSGFELHLFIEPLLYDERYDLCG